MTLEKQPGIEAQLAEMNLRLIQIHGLLSGPREIREWYTVEEVAAIVSKTPYTVREWCREGRVSAKKRSERRGGTELWKISAAEVARFKDEGLLSPDRYRNAG